jgi:hypothetical protein
MKYKMVLMPILLLCVSGAVHAMKQNQNQTNQNGKKVVYVSEPGSLLNLTLTEADLENNTQMNQNSSTNSGNVVYSSNRQNGLLNLHLTNNDLANVGMELVDDNSSPQNTINNQNSGATNGGSTTGLSPQEQAFLNARFALVNGNTSNGVVPGGNSVGVGGTISNGQPIQPNIISLENNYFINNIFVNIACLIIKRSNN